MVTSARISESPLTPAAAMALLNELPIAVMLVNSNSALLYANPLAISMLPELLGPGIAPDQLFHCGDDQRLKAFICAATHTRAAATLAPRNCGVIPRGPHQRPLQVITVRLPMVCSGPGPASLAADAILFRDPQQPPPVNLDRLIAMYRLTPSEGRIAAALSRDRSVAEIAHDFGIQPNTVRSHLKRVYAKTDTRNQCELAGLLARDMLLEGF